MQDFERGTVRANQLTFEYLTQGDGPLALCIHGFPDSPYSYRYLLRRSLRQATGQWLRSTGASPRPSSPRTATISTPA